MAARGSRRAGLSPDPYRIDIAPVVRRFMMPIMGGVGGIINRRMGDTGQENSGDEGETLVRCDGCGRAVPRHARYVLKMQLYADPALPPTTGAEIEAAADSMAAVLEELKRYSADELEDQVHRAFEFSLCVGCQQRFLANPLGQPRLATGGMGTATRGTRN